MGYKQVKIYLINIALRKGLINCLFTHEKIYDDEMNE